MSNFSDKIKTDEGNDTVKVKVDSEFYDLKAIYDAAYNFLDRAYVLLDGDKEKSIEVELKRKDENEDLKELGGDFLNELINTGLRNRISEKNQMIREYIVSAALVGASEELQKEIKKRRTDQSRDVSGAGEEWEGDPLEITKTWEEKYGKGGSEEAPANVFNGEEEVETDDEWEEDPLEITKTWEEKYGEETSEEPISDVSEFEDKEVDEPGENEENEESEEEESNKKKKEEGDKEEKSIEELDLTTRIINNLKEAGITTIGELEELTEEELKDVKGLGEKSVEKIQEEVNN